MTSFFEVRKSQKFLRAVRPIFQDDVEVGCFDTNLFGNGKLELRGKTFNVNAFHLISADGEMQVESKQESRGFFSAGRMIYFVESSRFYLANWKLYDDSQSAKKTNVNRPVCQYDFGLRSFSFTPTINIRPEILLFIGWNEIYSE